MRRLLLMCVIIACSGTSETSHKDYLETGVESFEVIDILDEEIEAQSLGEVMGADTGGALPDLVFVGVTPTKGSAQGGETVSLAGDGFQDGMIVVFDQSVSPLVIVTSPTSATAITPPHWPGSVRVMITRKDGQSAVVDNGFTYTNKTVITEVKPASCPVSGGVPITIKGAGFLGTKAVLFGGKLAPTFKVVDDSMINTIAPDNNEGFQEVMVATEIDHASLQDGIFYFKYPKISEIKPVSGQSSGGTIANIEGEGFYEGTEVFFANNLGGDVTIKEKTKLMVKTPPYGSFGPVDVTIKNPYGSFTLKNGFYYYKKEDISDVTKIKMITPSEGPMKGGNIVHIVASGLDKNKTEVWFGSKYVKVKEVNPDDMSLYVIAPPSVPGPVDVTVQTPLGKDTFPKGYSYFESVEVTKVEPSSGPTLGGTKVTIWGSGFEEGCVVSFGGLPGVSVKVMSSSAISAITPPGSPGPVSVRVEQGEKSGEKKNAFVYIADTQILAVSPDQGAIGGGTLVKIYGSNIPKDVKIFFGNNEASHVIVESSTTLTCRTPPGSVGTVDVKMISKDGKEFILKNGFTYFDPTGLYGGTWGGPTYGTLNVTVLDASQGGPLADAFVIVWTDPKTPYQGYTGPDGVVTFSGFDLKGKQMVSASKECYNNASIVAFDATNVTLYLQYVCPSSGMPPPGPPLGKVKGKVMGLGKYVIPPPGNCWTKGIAPDGINCKPCFSGMDSECGGGGNRCVQIADYGQFCTTPCNKPSDCPSGYVCMGTKTGDVQCMPEPLKKEAYCKSTIAHVFADEVPPGSKYKVDENMRYEIDVRPGTIAIVCLGGVTDPDTNIFKPYAMGVKRHLSVQPGQVLDDVNILLDVPMDRSFRVYFDDPPQGVPGPNINYLLIYYDFGVDGVFQQTWGNPYTFGSPEVKVEAQPRAFVGDLYDVSYVFLAGAFTLVGQNATVPFSISFHQGVTDLQDDSMFRLDNSTWSVIKTGVRKDVFGMWGQSYKELLAVGDEGKVYFYDGFSFTEQPVLGIKERLRAVHGAEKDDAWIVGENGRVIHFTNNGFTVEDIPIAKGYSLYGVACYAKNDCFVVGSQGFVMHYDGISWKKVSGAPYLDFYGIAPIGKEKALAVGMSGQVIRITPSFIIQESAGISQTLRGVTVTKSGEIWAVGDMGMIVRWSEGQWKVIPSQTNKNLYTVVSQGNKIVAFGDAGQIVRIENGTAIPHRIEGYAPHLRAGYADPNEGQPILAMGISQMMVGPFLQVPEMVYPKDGGTMKDLYIEFKAKEGLNAEANYILISIPGLFGDTPVWEMITAGDVYKIKLPDFENIEGTPGIPKGQFLKLTVLRIHKPDLTIDNFDYMDLSPFEQKGWSANIIMFQRE